MYIYINHGSSVDFRKKMLGMSSDILDKLTVRLGTNLEKIYVMRLFKI